MEQQKIKSKKSNRFDTQETFELINKHIVDFTGYSEYKNNSKVLDLYVEGSNVWPKSRRPCKMQHNVMKTIIKT